MLHASVTRPPRSRLRQQFAVQQHGTGTGCNQAVRRLPHTVRFCFGVYRWTRAPPDPLHCRHVDTHDMSATQFASDGVPHRSNLPPSSHPHPQAVDMLDNTAAWRSNADLLACIVLLGQPKGAVVGLIPGTLFRHCPGRSRMTHPNCAGSVWRKVDGAALGDAFCKQHTRGSLSPPVCSASGQLQEVRNRHATGAHVPRFEPAV